MNNNKKLAKDLLLVAKELSSNIKVSKLMKRQINILDKWSDTSEGKRELSKGYVSYDDLSNSLQSQLERVKNQETLWSDVERYLGDIATTKRFGKKTTKTFPCPECGTKVLENTKYCMKCKKKVEKTAKKLVASPNYLKMLKKKKGMDKGDYSYYGEIDGIVVNVVRSTPTMYGNVVTYDIQVGVKGSYVNRMTKKITEREVNDIIGKFLKDELNYKEKMNKGTLLSIREIKDKFEDMHINVSLSDLGINKISKEVYKRLSNMDETKLDSMRNKGRRQLVNAEENNDDEGIVEGALMLIYSKSLMKMF